MPKMGTLKDCSRHVLQYNCDTWVSVVGKFLTDEYVSAEIERLMPGYKKLSKYVEKYTKIDFQCDVGHFYSATFGSVRIGTKCPHCSGNAKLSDEFISKKITSLLPGYEKLSEYVRNPIAKARGLRTVRL